MAMIIMAMAVIIIACLSAVWCAGEVTGAGHRQRGTGHCAAGNGAVNESECEDIANAVAGYTWWYAGSLDYLPSGCYVDYSFGRVYYNSYSGNDCSVNSNYGCICACASGRYSSAAMPPNGACTACDAGIYLSLAVSGSILTLSLTADSDGYNIATY